MKTILLFLLHPRIWMLGYRECESGFGMTYDHPDTIKSQAYDSGRYFGWKVKGIQ